MYKHNRTVTGFSYLVNPFVSLITIVVVALGLAACSSTSTKVGSADEGLPLELEREYLGPDLWELVEADYQFAPKHYDHRLVKRYVSRLKANKDYVQGVNHRASAFLYHIRQELKKRNMPAEFALLPAVESGYDPYAFSHAGASGLWQFTERTGRHFGLDNIWWYSERRDFEESTEAALDYLEYLYAKYDNWELSLAAYNAGEKRVNKAIRYNKARGRPTNYWALSALPRETEEYVPRLVAYSYVFSKAMRDEMGIDNIAAQDAWVKVPLTHQVPLAELVADARIDEEKFYLLNAGHNQWVTSPYKGYLYVTYEDYPRMQKAISNFEKNARLWVSYQIQEDDNIRTIAAKFNVTESAISKFNQVAELKPNSYLVLPVRSSEIQYLSADQDPPRYLVVQGNLKDHRIRKGENLHSIAQSYKVSVSSIQRINDISNPNRIKAGQKIIVKEGKHRQSPEILLTDDYDREVIRTVYYRVRSGDTLYSIARKFNVGVDKIKEWNPNKSLGNRLYAKQTIKLRLDVTDL